MADIHQLAQFWLTPPVNLWVFVIVGVLFWRSKRNVLICLCSGLIITYIQYTPLFAKELTNLIYPKLDRSYNNLKIKPQAIVVLGAGVTSCINYLVSDRKP